MIEAFLHYHFLQNAFITGMIIGIVAPLLGSFIVVRRLSLIADALSHVTLSGVAASVYLSKTVEAFAALNPLYLGIIFSVISSILIEKLRTFYKHFQELAIPIIMSGGIGVGLIFISLANGFNVDLLGYLFGSVSAVSETDLLIIIVIGVVVLATIVLFYKELFLLSFDEEFARASGIQAKTIHFLFMILVALVIAGSMRIVGVLLVSSLMTLPVAASIRITKGFKQAIFFSIIFGEIAVISGLIAAFYLNMAPGATIVVASVILLMGSAAYKKVRESWR